MHNILIPDTSCIIALEKIGIDSIMNDMYDEVIITEEVKKEFIFTLPDWIKVTDTIDRSYYRILEQILDKGEASIIALALGIENPIIAIDDLKGRKVASSLGLKVTGTLGLIFKAKQSGLINSVRNCIEDLRKVDFRISENIVEELIKLSGE